MSLCSKCKEKPAVLFVRKIENGKEVTEGYCLSCAKELGIAPLDKMLQAFNISEEDVERMNDQMASLMEEMGGEDGNMEYFMESLLGKGGEGFDGMPNPMSMFMGGGDEFDGEDFDGFDGIPQSFMTLIMPGKEQNLSDKSDLGKKKDVANNDNKSSSKENKREKPNKKKKKTMLDTYGTNLTEKAMNGEIDKVVNRNSEIDRVIQILNRRSKNNPVLLGEPGVGKTAVAEGLAGRICEKNVPPKLFGCQLYLIDFTALVAGTQFRGQFEARLKNLLAEASERKDVILVIDEVHNIVAAGDAEGAMSAANILKPALARGEIQIIGATTLTEYRKHIEKDSALERRFQPVLVDEPSLDESIEILKGIKGYYEKYHSVKISDKIVEQAVRLSERYITDRFLPDKAIDVIDEAASRVNLNSKAIYDLSILQDEVKQCEEELSGINEDDFEKIAEIKTRQMQALETIDKIKPEAESAEITFDDIAAVIENWTKIPVHRLTSDETEKLLNLEENIHNRVVGQDEAVRAVARAIRRGRADITTRKRPVSFIFAGPTGVGKTELVKTIAEVMFDNEESLIRVDMSEYMEKESVSKLIGSPPGYVGYDDAGQLTEKVRRKPYSVILLDEIEKAHPEVFNLFLQILDDGRVADSHGKIINFENTIIIMTTNAGSEFKAASLGFNSNDEVKMEDNVDKSLKQIFKPEFLNRIDEIVTFKPLTKDNLRAIIDLLLKDIYEKLDEKGASLDVEDNAKELILEKGYDSKYGARPLKRAIQTLLEDKLAVLSLTGKIKSGCCIVADKDGDEIVLTVNE